MMAVVMKYHRVHPTLHVLAVLATVGAVGTAFGFRRDLPLCQEATGYPLVVNQIYSKVDAVACPSAPNLRRWIHPEWHYPNGIVTRAPDYDFGQCKGPLIPPDPDTCRLP